MNDAIPIRPKGEGTVAFLQAPGRVLAPVAEEEVLEADEVIDMNDEDDNARVPKIATRPYTPTKKEREEHDATDLPFRSWCKYCVYGKGVHSPHCAGDDEKTGRATVSLDYCFMGEDAHEEIPPIIVMWDNRSGMMWALPVEEKGPVGYVVKWCAEKLERAGYGGVAITLKSDGEASVVALKRSIALRRTAETMPIESPVRESKSNGAIERDIRTWQGQFRTLKNRLEDNLKNVEMGHPLAGWLVMWASELIGKFTVRPNGRTAYEDITGHKCKHPVVMFAETIHFKMPIDKSKRNKAESDWQTGFFVGVNSGSTEFLVIIIDGLYKCRTIRRLENNLAFDVDTLDKATKTIDEYIHKGATANLPGVCGGGAPEHVGVPLDKDGYAPRRAKLRAEYFTRIGYTIGCKGCTWLQDGIGGRQGHSEECRQRTEGEIGKTDGGQERIIRATNRQEQWAAEEI